MSENVTQPQGYEPGVDWTPPMPPTDLIFDDGEPLETHRHRIAMNVLLASAHGALTEREDYFTGGNMFVYFSSEQARNRDFRGPDFFVVLDVDPNPNRERQGWVVWEEGGRYPDVIVELTSGSTAREDYGRKKEIYERVFRTRDYFVYHPFDPQSLQGWHLGGRGYEDIPRGDRGWLWCDTLGVWLGVEEGTVQRETAPWLRFFRPDGSLILLPEEEAKRERQRAEVERQRAEAALAEVERLKAQLGQESAGE
ncbi:Uma2 family endonuclease [Geitlerinema sp. P-1104]|uniref:Uma2 family endonuclease n=1 Tax=Geitlerinema sp. P-1104 TaxID=2546230 RepID=UPI00147745D1|nr:Uma2 family endonuclease [Geitlerinema sp. P-1104]NMG61049.1 Uma2 family endonuclease [Geitlerinema sp. P-1104]